MSAVEHSLMAMLLAAEPTTQEAKALWRVITLYANNDRMTCHELRVYQIAMEGLGFAPARIRVEVEVAIQRKRDRLALLYAEREGVSNAPP